MMPSKSLWIQLRPTIVIASFLALMLTWSTDHCTADALPQQVLPDQLAVLWEYDSGEAIEAAPAVSSGRVFVADVMGKVTAIDQQSGAKIWSKDFGTGFIASPAVQGEVLVIGDFDGNVYAMSTDDGTLKWQTKTDGEINGSVTFYKDTVLAASQDGNLYCYKLNDGALKWTYETGDQIRCSPTVAGNRTFLGGCDAKLHIVDLDTGKAASEPLPLGGPTGSTPAVQGDQVFVPIMDGAVYAFDWKTQKQTWMHEDEETQQEYRNSPAVTDQVVILSSARKQVDALSIKTGKPLWRYTLRRRADASPVIAGQDVFIAGTDGRLVRLKTKDGSIAKWSFEIRGSFVAGPTIANQHLFIADDKGVVRCFGSKDVSAKQ
ncbi:Outer membrane protein assembly factor BamB precursor [Rubripirellula obstinata]|uniref:Outer membrane protein assembly factor BamB n=1 Tax=Rubripirellula obstinata TaxID=406547 RepID=A0A5B1CLZ1_9BACT|nr:PQQ-binding-like beta-propeller repeat protein [Rubripirellula obstinata]KAA1261556.1 Outer membrane protein assembly factor BamB precursor [Rubripirellula obstinata]